MNHTSLRAGAPADAVGPHGAWFHPGEWAEAGPRADGDAAKLTGRAPWTRARSDGRSRRPWSHVAAGAVPLLVLSTTLVGGAGASASTPVPYADPSAQGYIGLCNQADQQITSGSVDDTPLAWRAVSSVPAPAPYNGASRTAILQAFQPLQNLPPADWSGQQMTASSRYSNPANPMAAATAGDNSLADFLTAYPAHWDGFVQLRMYLGAAGATPYESHYPVLDLQVTGSTWTAVDGGSVNCNSGTAVSIETILLHPTTTTTAPVAPTGSTSGSTTGGGSTKGTSGGQAGTQPPTDPSHDPVAAADTSHPSHGWLIAGLVVAAALIVGLALWFTIRRRAVDLPSSESDITNSSPTKGQ